MAGPDLVGTVIDRVEFPVEAGKIRELAIAVGDPDPVYLDRRAARSAGHPDIPAPPTFVVVAGHWRDQAAMVQTLGIDIRRVVVGDTSWEHLAPVHAGDRLSGDRVVESVTERPGRRGGTMTLIAVVCEFRNQRGERCVRQRDTVIEMGA
ncbi:MAG TPA: MaoC family dehydratase N-terminal domain-containing protein [Solirubrobacteraceae bacterium]